VTVKVEEAGIPTVGIVASGFELTARALAASFNHPTQKAIYPGVIMTDDDATFRGKVIGPVMDGIVEGLTGPDRQAAGSGPAEPAPRDIVAVGGLDDIYDAFAAEGWTDGLPIVPPTLDRVDAFLAFTDRDPDEVIGILEPAQRQSTVWNVAVNGVMAGCRPEYMPILVGIAEVISDPEWTLRNGGSTPGWEPIVIVSGPLVKELDFNAGQGVLRAGRQANSSVGRFLRMYMRNVAGLRVQPGGTDGALDKACLGLNFNVVLAEDSDVLAGLGWPSYGADRGFPDPDTTVVTALGIIGISYPIMTAGSTPEQHLSVIAQNMTAAIGPWLHCGIIFQKWNPLLVMSPSVASVMAKAGWGKPEIRNYLFENALIEAGLVEDFTHDAGVTSFSFESFVEQGLVPEHYFESDDPKRLVRICMEEERTEIVVSGDPDRNQSRAFVPNCFGPAVSRGVKAVIHAK
jgi:hypothetical protein